MTEIQQNRYDQLVRRVNNIVAPGSMVGDSLNELFPVLDVERVPGELLALMGTDICVGSSTLTAVAGEAPRIQLFNPLDSRMLITVTDVIVSSNVATIIRIAINNTVLAGSIATQVFRDRRNLLTSRPVGGIFQEDKVAFVDANFQVRIGIAEPFFLKDENGVAVLNPGSGIEVGNATFASNLTVTFLWRERVGEPSELNL